MTHTMSSRVSIRAVTLAAALAAIAIMLAFATGLLTVGAQEVEDNPAVPALISEPAQDEEPTMLTIEGTASRSVAHDGVLARFTVSVLDDSVLKAAEQGNQAVEAIRDAIDEHCTPGEPDNADHTAPPTCISPEGLNTTGINIREEFDWTDAGRVSTGFRYEYSLQIALRGTGFGGKIVDLVIRSGGDHVRFDSIRFTASRTAEAQRMALLDAIDDAQATAASITEHMGYEIVRVVEVTPQGGFAATSSRDSFEQAEFAMADDSYTETPVFGGTDSVTARVQVIYEIRPQ